MKQNKKLFKVMKQNNKKHQEIRVNMKINNNMNNKNQPQVE